MASAGEKRVENLGSDIVYELICQPCNNRGKILEAEGLCVDCKDYLCKGCFDYHTSLTVTKDHVLLDKQQMLQQTVSIPMKDRCTEKCPKHDGKIGEYFCTNHSVLGCSVCMTVNHRTCDDVQYIPDVSMEMTKTEIYREFAAQLKSAQNKSAAVAKDLKQKLESIDTHHSGVLQEVKDFRKQINDALDKVEREIIKQADRMKREETTKFNNTKDKCTKAQTEIQAISAKIEMLENQKQYCSLYIDIMKLKGKLQTLENELSEAENVGDARTYMFKPNKELLELLNGPEGLGELHVTCAGVINKADYLTDISIKSTSDTSTTYYVYGSAVLPNNRLLVTDYNNKKLKMIDTNQRQVISELQLTSNPFDVAMVTDSQVVSTLLHPHKLVFVKIGQDSRMTVDREIKVNGQCRGVALYEKDKLVVTFDSPHKMEIMDMQGKVLRSISTDSQGKALFNYPNNLAVSPDSKFIYVSNWSANNVICLRSDGTVVTTYTDSELSNPTGVVVDTSGTVYVCGRNSGNIHQITADCQKIKVLPTTSDGLTFPWSISYSESDAKFYIGKHTNVNVEVLRVS